MSKKNDLNFVREPMYNFGTKVIKSDSGIEYCVEYISEDKKQTRLLWVKQLGKFVRLNARKLDIEKNIDELLV